MLGFDLPEWENGKMCSNWLKFNLSVFDLSVVKLVIQRTALVGKQKRFDLCILDLSIFNCIIITIFVQFIQQFILLINMLCFVPRNPCCQVYMPAWIYVINTPSAN